MAAVVHACMPYTSRPSALVPVLMLGRQHVFVQLANDQRETGVIVDVPTCNTLSFRQTVCRISAQGCEREMQARRRGRGDVVGQSDAGAAVGALSVEGCA